MGSTFGGQTLTPTGKVGNDTINPSDQYHGFGSLVTSGGQAINSPMPFASPLIAQDLTWVHGIQRDQVEDDQIITINGNCEEIIWGNWDFVVHGSSSAVSVGPSLENFLSTQTVTNVDEIYQTQQSTGWDVYNEQYERVGFYFELAGAYIEVMGLQLTVAAADIVLAAFEGNYTLATQDVKLLQDTFSLSRTQYAALNQSIGDLEFDVNQMRMAAEIHSNSPAIITEILEAGAVT